MNQVSQAMMDNNREELLNALFGESSIAYELQVELAEFIFTFHPDLAMKIFEFETRIALSYTTLATAAFNANNEEMVVLLMDQEELKNQEVRMGVIQFALNQKCALVSLFHEEIIDLYISTQDDKLITDMTPELEKVHNIFIF